MSLGFLGANTGQVRHGQPALKTHNDEEQIRSTQITPIALTTYLVFTFIETVFGGIATAYSLWFLKVPMVWGDYHHAHAHVLKDWWSWMPNNVLNMTGIGVTVDTFSCLFLLLTPLFAATRTFLRSRCKSTKYKCLGGCSDVIWLLWRGVNVPFAILGIFGTGTALGTLLPLTYFNMLGPCTNSSEGHHDHDHGRQMTHDIALPFGEDEIVAPYHIQVMDTFQLSLLIASVIVMFVCGCVRILLFQHTFTILDF